MPADHFLPATYIARFSSDVGPSRRQRVFVLRAGAARPDRQAAEQVARIRGLYDDVIPGTRMDLEHNVARAPSTPWLHRALQIGPDFTSLAEKHAAGSDARPRRVLGSADGLRAKSRRSGRHSGSGESGA